MNTKDLKNFQVKIKDYLLSDKSWKKRKATKAFSNDEFDRIKIYRDLIRSSFNSILSSNFKYTKNILKSEWNQTIDKYIEAFPPKSPILIDIGKDFPYFLKLNKKFKRKYPYLFELALFEWTETEVTSYHKIKKDISLNSSSKILTFSYSIPEIINSIKSNVEINNPIKKKTFVIVFRDPKNNDLKSFELTKATKAYLNLIKKGKSISYIKNRLIKTFKIKDKNTFSTLLQRITIELKENGVLI